MTNNLGAARAAAGMSQDAMGAALNDGLGTVDAAITEDTTVIFDSTTEMLTELVFTGNYHFTATAGSPAPGAACTLNVPAINAKDTTLKRGSFHVTNDLAQDLTVQVSGQSRTPPTLAAGQSSILTMNGTDVILGVPQGAIGADGSDAGIRWSFDTSTDTASDPGDGDLRLNNATLASVTEIGLSDSCNETGNPDASGWLATWDDSTSATKGYVTIKDTANPENFAVYAVTAATDATTHWRMTVTHVDSAGSFDASDSLSVQFVPKGDIGPGSIIAVAQEGESPEVINASTETLRFWSGFTVTDDGGGQVTVSGGGGGGVIAQVMNVQDGAFNSGTGQIPRDNTIPQNTGGLEVMTLAITPTDAASTLLIEVVVYGSPQNANRALPPHCFRTRRRAHWLL